MDVRTIVMVTMRTNGTTMYQRRRHAASTMSSGLYCFPGIIDTPPHEPDEPDPNSTQRRNVPSGIRAFRRCSDEPRWAEPNGMFVPLRYDHRIARLQLDVLLQILLLQEIL